LAFESPGLGDGLGNYGVDYIRASQTFKFFLGDPLMDSLDINDTCKRPISFQNIYVWFVKPICFAAPNGVATHSFKSLDYITVKNRDLLK